VRWSRTIRISRPGGYLGYVVTHATFWCLVAALAGAWQIAIVGLVVRLAAAASALLALGADVSSLPFVPFRDLVGFGVWCAGLFGNTVEWRGERFRLLRDGRMVNLRSGGQAAKP
jgi:ceramide glucosyltransferase